MLDRLKREARTAAMWRGHNLGRFVTATATRAYATCQNEGCTAGVSVDTHPAPNGIDIGGDAVAVGCPVRVNAVQAEKD